MMKKIFLPLWLLLTVQVNAQLTQSPTPDQLWGKLFTDVQLKRVLHDNKTFVDAVPKLSPDSILNLYNRLPVKDSSSLSDFVHAYFILPEHAEVATPKQATDLKDHLQKHWNNLVRQADKKQHYNSLLPLPYPYVVPGGRFREIYYWDSYFTMLGLAASNRYDLVEHMLNNFSYLVKTYGHIPNGNRNYYLSRSQPPYFALMVQLLAQKKGSSIYRRYLPALQKEYDYWMEGEDIIKPGELYKRIMKMQDGTVLNRYFDDSTIPRQESYYEDVQTGLAYKHKDGAVYRHLRAAAESGWDFSSRWFADTFNLTSIETTNILPVDLNCLLYTYEQILATAYASQRQNSKSRQYSQRAQKRKEAINRLFWSEEKQYYFDYHTGSGTHTDRWSLAGVMPLFVQAATQQQAAAVTDHVRSRFLKPGGVVTTTYKTGEQWDAPNGWPPLQYVTVKGLTNYKHNSLADTIARRWMKINEDVYQRTGKMMEKYDVEVIGLEGGGGEYPTQDGFGWTNGVYLEFRRMFK
ncbi:alpha,alpha-trehalase TreA [Aridibaculum aurantiacum]|uniref:alpha,alpha-trehalase TreA n=1 Tax=Aridibaculum aurantiacum TaxID=2810307 RepID=UPI001A96FF57|nr:alpha,alpha-trehalase TreA [Aridibaculum aurantiacum]